MAKLRTKLREYRKDAGMTQDELAERIGVRRETIVHLENGRYNPSLKMAMDIAHLFHTTVEEMFWFAAETEDEEESDKDPSLFWGRKKRSSASP